MKNLLLIICLALFFSCNEAKTSTADLKNNSKINSDINTLEGAWELVSFINYGENEIPDTILSSSTNKQIKMYSHTKVMWSRTRISDSIDWFAYGDYTVKDGVLTEILDYGSKSMNEVIKEKIRQSRRYMVEALNGEGVTLVKESYWQLYVELIIQKSINKVLITSNFLIAFS